MEKISENLIKSPRHISPPLITTAVVLFVCIGLFIGGVSVYGSSVTNVSARGLLVGAVPVGGMNESELTGFITDMTEKMLTSDMEFSLESEGRSDSIFLEPLVVVSSDGTTRELVLFNVRKAVKEIISFGKKGNRFERGIALLKIRFNQPSIALPGTTINTISLTEELSDRTSKYTTKPINASIEIKQADPIEVMFTDSKSGISYDVDAVIQSVTAAYESLTVPQVPIALVVQEADIVKDELFVLEDIVSTVLDQFPLYISYINTSTNKKESWTLYPERAAELLQPKRNEELFIGLHEERFLTYLEEIVSPDVFVAAQDARFSMSGGKASEFQIAKTGIEIATTTMVARMEQVILERNVPDADVTSTLLLAVNVTQPEISTEDVNDLGLTELLGEGESDFSGSPSNRIGNIRNAVNKLNGLLIAPGEEFSTIDHTKPYTLEGGYLPELVIKGDEIIPEIAGGLCQIGTTLFRTAMNSGMNITQRRNHSLVVGYYNDLENGLPGTDATLYDPAPDFKFINDTEHYILLETNMNVSTGRLKFYLWGTNDGRSASYSRPTVEAWYEPAETKYIETTKLEPGVQECQHAYRGASTSFTYSRMLPGTTEAEETVYTSKYRALPKICLIGVEEETMCQELPDGSTSCAVEDVFNPANDIIDVSVVTST